MLNRPISLTNYASLREKVMILCLLPIKVRSVSHLGESRMKYFGLLQLCVCAGLSVTGCKPAKFTGSSAPQPTGRNSSGLSDDGRFAPAGSGGGPGAGGGSAGGAKPGSGGPGDLKDANDPNKNSDSTTDAAKGPDGAILAKKEPTAGV
jgi:hypothetical protein